MSLELIMGPMFAGKSSKILSIKNRMEAIGKTVLVIKHSIDVRYLTTSSSDSNDSTDSIINHDRRSCPATACSNLCSLLGTSDFVKADLIIIDEGQFFEDLATFVTEAVEKFNKDLVVVGLDGDAHRKPFGQMLEIEPLADDITILKALCQICADGTKARFTAAKSKQVLDLTKDGVPNVGDDSSYLPVCRKHWLSVSKGL
jgi:thymidine kinase